MGQKPWLAALAVLPLAFAAGWASRPSPVAAAVATEPPKAAPATCVDPAAMAANQNLVGQVREANARLASAAASAREASAALTLRDQALPTALVTSPEEWIQMGREGRLRLRSPCASLRGTSHVLVRSPRRGWGRTRPSDTAMRAELAGLSEQETEAVAELYDREHARTWAKMKAACAALSPPREEGEADGRRATDDGPAREPTDFERIVACRDLATARLDTTLVSRIAELHAAGVAPRLGKEPPAVVALHPLGDAGEDLTRSLVALLGREKAARVLAYGAVCVDELFVTAARPNEG